MTPDLLGTTRCRSRRQNVVDIPGKQTSGDTRAVLVSPMLLWHVRRRDICRSAPNLQNVPSRDDRLTMRQQQRR
jgi:hypothetical protein